jgi:hypothetical protein
MDFLGYVFSFFLLLTYFPQIYITSSSNTLNGNVPVDTMKAYEGVDL